MNFRLKVALWYAFSVLALAAVLVLSAHQHLDEELRKDRWDRSHPKFAEWVIHGSYTNEEVADILGELVKVWLWLGVPILVGSLGIGYFIALQSVRPIRRINRELAAIDSQSLERGVRFQGKDPELTLLVQHINELLGRLGRSYGEMAEFSARVAHELRTPLTLLRMRLESAAPDMPVELSEEMQEQIGRLSQLVERSLLAAKAEGGKLEVQIARLDLTALLDDLREGYTLLAAERAITLEWRAQSGLACNSDPELLRQILHNLLGNALRHGAGRARLTARSSRRPGRIIVCITNVMADGKAAVAGTGIGLRLVRALTNFLSGTQFRTREFEHVFSVRIAIQSALLGSTKTKALRDDAALPAI